MKKTVWILAFALALHTSPITARAAEAADSIKSCGSIIFQDGRRSVAFYAEDIALLQAKLPASTLEAFDPAMYSHTHSREYLDITETTHILHCSQCGPAYDLVDRHKAAATQRCTIFLDENEYAGYEMICECGYSWQKEAYHTLVCIPEDDYCHTLTCALAGTKYCGGITEEEEAHSGAVYPADDAHHMTICDDCGFEGDMEECVFDYDSEWADEEHTQKLWYCECGNYITGTGEDPDKPETPDPDKDTEQTPGKDETDDPDKEDTPKTPDPDEETGKTPGKDETDDPDRENADKPGGEEQPETPDPAKDEENDPGMVSVSGNHIKKLRKWRRSK